MAANWRFRHFTGIHQPVRGRERWLRTPVRSYDESRLPGPLISDCPDAVPKRRRGTVKSALGFVALTSGPFRRTRSRRIALPTTFGGHGSPIHRKPAAAWCRSSAASRAPMLAYEQVATTP